VSAVSPPNLPDPLDPDDPKGLIREAYRIDGIDGGGCRSILLDWALSLPSDRDPALAMAALLARHGAGAPDAHPMSALLRAALGAPPAVTGRRGGATGRRSGAGYPDASGG
jgi:hypothetical protein